MRNKRTVIKKDGQMTVAVWLALNANGVVRLTAGEPRLAPGERAMRIQINVPLAIFKTPMMTAEISVSESEVGARELDAKVIEAAEDALKQAIGMDVSVNVVPSEQA